MITEEAQVAKRSVPTLSASERGPIDEHGPIHAACIGVRARSTGTPASSCSEPAGQWYGLLLVGTTMISSIACATRRRFFVSCYYLILSGSRQAADRAR